MINTNYENFTNEKITELCFAEIGTSLTDFDSN